MKVIKRIILGLLSIAIIVGIGLTLFKKIQEQRIMKMISDGQVTIDQETHEWGVCEENSPVRIDMYVRNNGQYEITGTLVFSGALSKKGLEERFMEKFISCYGEERLKKEFKEEFARKGPLGRLEAVNNYILRGRQLPKGQVYEPVESKTENKDYAFKFRDQIFIRPGEILKITHLEQLPLEVRGDILTVKLETIEF